DVGDPKDSSHRVDVPLDQVTVEAPGQGERKLEVDLIPGSKPPQVRPAARLWHHVREEGATLDLDYRQADSVDGDAATDVKSACEVRLSYSQPPRTPLDDPTGGADDASEHDSFIAGSSCVVPALRGVPVSCAI